jgi:hypothetical protein
MYKANGYFPVLRCVCGREVLVKRATVCACGNTLRVGGLTKHYRKRYRIYGWGNLPENWNGEPIHEVGWVNDAGEWYDRANA